MIVSIYRFLDFSRLPDLHSVPALMLKATPSKIQLIMTREEALEFKNRYRAVNELEIEELRSASIESKLAQLSSLMLLARQTGWDRQLADEVGEVRGRWVRLKRLMVSE